MYRPYRTIVAIALATSLLAAACGDDDANTAAEPAPSDAAPEDPVVDDDTAGGALMTAGELRATLTSHLQEHVYLSGVVVETLADAAGDPDDADASAALAALDDNSLAIAGLVSAAAPDQEEAFLDMWREHVGFFMDYARAGITGESADQTDALANLDGYRTASGAFFEALTGGALPADAVADNFAVHVDTLLAAFDALVRADADAFERLRTAAQHMSVSAQALATGFSTALPDAFPGDVADPEAETRATLTYLLGEHVFLSGISFEQLIEADGQDGPAVNAAFEELDKNSVAIAGVIGSLAPDEEDGFLELWREHLGFFTAYALGAIDNADDTKAMALANLDGYRSASAAFFETLTAGALPADAVAENFKGHVDTLNRAIDAMAAGDHQGFAALRDAARHMPSTAAALTAGVHGS